MHLFDLKNDPLEEYNLANENYQKIDEFEKLLGKVNNKLDFTTKKSDDKMEINEAKEIEAKLKEAGYIN